jgi:RND family efflux transporter MFP subunit
MASTADDNRYRTLLRRVVVSEILIVILLAGSAGIYYRMYSQKPQVQEKEALTAFLNVDVFEAEAIDFRELLTAFGTARADREVVVAAQVSGEVTEIHPDLNVGASVYAGADIVHPDRPTERRLADTLVRIDARDYQDLVDQATSRINEAEAEIDHLQQQLKNTKRQLVKARLDLKTLQDEYKRIEDAFNKGAGTPSELSRALLELRRYEDTIIQLESQESVIPLQIATAEQRIETGRSERQRAINNLSRTRVAAPFDGVLSEVNVEQGQYVRSGESLFRLTDLRRVEVPVSMKLDDFLLIERRLQLKQYPQAMLAEHEQADVRWSGTVVRSAPEADSSSRTIEMFVEVVNDDDSSAEWLLPGTFVHARIEGPVYTDTILIPRSALIEGHVYVVDETGIARKRKVQTGRPMQSMIVVKSGLESGDRIVLTNLDIVEDGRQVEVQQRIQVAEEVADMRVPVVRLLDSSEPSASPSVNSD